MALNAAFRHGPRDAPASAAARIARCNRLRTVSFAGHHQSVQAGVPSRSPGALASQAGMASAGSGGENR